MRIIAGKFRGRKLAAVRGEIRPTTDRLRESLFSMLGSQVEDSTWLDPFCGSGAVGIEAISRGAKLVIFNDRNPTALRTLRRNLEICQVLEGFEVRNQDGFTLLHSYQGAPLDFIFLDPPYHFGRYEKLLKKLLVSSAFGPETTLLLELFKKTRLDFLPVQLEAVGRVQAGDSLILSLQRTG